MKHLKTAGIARRWINERVSVGSDVVFKRVDAEQPARRSIGLLGAGRLPRLVLDIRSFQL